MALKTTKKVAFDGPDLHPRQFDLIKVASQHRHTLAYGSARGGKTFALAAFIITRALRYNRSNHLVLRLTGNSVKTTIWKTFEDVLDTFGLRSLVAKNLTDLTMSFPNGSTIVFSGVQDEERIAKILGAEYQTIFLNEATEIDYPTYEIVASRLNGNAFDDDGNLCKLKSLYDCNPTAKSHWLYQMFVRGVVPGTERGLTKHNDYTAIQFDRDANPSVDDDYYDAFADKTSSAQRRFLYGEWSDEVVGALFSEDDINDNREIVPEPEEFDLIVVGVDPAVTNNENSDETGIIVAGMLRIDGQAHYYPLEDLSGKYHPHEWAAIVAKAYQRWGAGMVVVETTQGGDQNAHTLRTADARLVIKTVNPGRGEGKNARALPIAAEMRSKRIHHPLDRSRFAALERQMLAMTGDYNRRKAKSPDRLDAYVYAISELLTGDGPTKPVVVSRIAGYFR